MSSYDKDTKSPLSQLSEGEGAENLWQCLQNHFYRFEVIKVWADNALVTVKLDMRHDYFYVASVYDTNASKLEHMKQTGRIKPFDK